MSEAHQLTLVSPIAVETATPSPLSTDVPRSTVSAAGGRNKPPHKTATRPQLEPDRLFLRVCT
jgi:hypothetical protein